MLAGGIVSNCFDLTPHDELVAPFFGQLGLALGYVVWIYLNIFESERYFGIKNQGMIQSGIVIIIIILERRGTM